MALADEAQKPAIEKMLARLCGLEWPQLDGLRTSFLPTCKANDAHYLNAHATKFANTVPDSSVAVVSLAVDFGCVRTCRNVTVQHVSSQRAFERTIQLQLQAAGLELVSAVAGKLQNSYARATVTVESVRAWLRQFQALGSNEHIGRSLLALLDYWPENRVLEALGIDEGGLAGYDCVAVTGEREGESSGVIASTIRTALGVVTPRRSVKKLRTVASRSPSGHCLLVEDCLMTGYEMGRLFASWLGQDNGTGTKAKPLRSPENLRALYINLRFAVVTNGGRAALTKQLEDLQLRNVHVDSGRAMQDLATHTPKGLAAIKRGEYHDTDGCVSAPTNYLCQPVFAAVDVWGSSARAKKARDFCRVVGSQLVGQEYKRKHKKRPERWIEEFGLGASGLSLAVAFAHGVPKATLPLFWCSGHVQYQGAELDWMPLLPS